MTAAGVTKDFLTIGGKGLLLLSTAAPTVARSAANLSLLPGLGLLPTLLPQASKTVPSDYAASNSNSTQSNIERHAILHLTPTPADLTSKSAQNCTGELRLPSSKSVRAEPWESLGLLPYPPKLSNSYRQFSPNMLNT